MNSRLFAVFGRGKKRVIKKTGLLGGGKGGGGREERGKEEQQFTPSTATTALFPPNVPYRNKILPLLLDPTSFPRPHFKVGEEKRESEKGDFLLLLLILAEAQEERRIL